MCAIAGIINYSNSLNIRNNLSGINLMLNVMHHRGPDASSSWTNNDDVVLGHCRLAIQDLSELGAQPMHSISKRYTIVFNGEIYNFNAIKQELSEKFNAVFIGNSDTEVLVNAIEMFGLEKTLNKLNGMFAFALWDNQEHTLTLVQDRAAKKPLYFGYVGDSFVFSSELKAIVALPGFKKDIDRDALGLYFKKNYIPAPHSIYNNIHKLNQGSLLTLNKQSFYYQQDIFNQVHQYWTPQCVEKTMNSRNCNFVEAKSHLDHLLLDSTEIRMVADVPIGVMLSGGIDSTLVTAVSQQVSSHPIKTFSLGFSDFSLSEAESAKKIAEHLKTDHEELYITGDDALGVVPLIPNIVDEPFGDSSLIPTYLISKLAREKITVALTGDGGDELFYGYKRYFSSALMYKKLQATPKPIRKGLSLMSHALGAMQAPENALKKHTEILVSSHPLDLYNLRKDKFINPEKLVLGSQIPEDISLEEIKAMHIDSPELNIMLYDYKTYLTGDILTKVDRATMAVSLEARNPILDKRIVEFAWSLPQEYKTAGKQGKYILKSLLNDYVPKELTDRPKQGFGAPLREWLTGPLRSWADELLNEEKLHNQGILNAKLVRRLWEECMENNKKSFSRIWVILMFQFWYDSQL